MWYITSKFLNCIHICFSDIRIGISNFTKRWRSVSIRCLDPFHCFSRFLRRSERHRRPFIRWQFKLELISFIPAIAITVLNALLNAKSHCSCKICSMAFCFNINYIGNHRTIPVCLCSKCSIWDKNRTRCCFRLYNLSCIRISICIENIPDQLTGWKVSLFTAGITYIIQAELWNIRRVSRYPQIDQKRFTGAIGQSLNLFMTVQVI